MSGQQSGTGSPVRQVLAHRAERIRNADESPFLQLLRLAEGAKFHQPQLPPDHRTCEFLLLS